MNPPISVALVGCGAVADLYYGPALAALERDGVVVVTGLVDPDPARRALLGARFPRARTAATRAGAGDAPALAIVTAPPRLHAELTVDWLSSGAGVLCEKPMAANVAEAEAMIAAADRHGRLLAIGHFRRFFPAMEAVAGFVRDATFGALLRFDLREGGAFDWPSATPALFDPAQAGGGVLMDIGTHVLDVLCWWLGDPLALEYADDAQGGLEANCRLRLRYAADPSAPAREIGGGIFLSRDWDTGNLWRLDFERATVCWRAGRADRLEIKPSGSDHWLVCALETEGEGWRRPADTYRQAFVRQIADAADALAAGRAPRASAREAIRSLRVIGRCYAERRPLEAPWVPSAESPGLPPPCR